MPCEIEVKFRIAHPAELRVSLQRAGAQCQGRVLEVNTLFDTAAGELRSRGCGVRVRECHPLEAGKSSPPRLTFKGPAVTGRFKTREELETTVASAAVLSEILIRLGYRPALVYEKRRETWVCGECQVTLDELPKLGWFAEIEGPDEGEIEAMQLRLQLDAAEVVLETYVGLAARHGSPEAGGVTALRF